MVQQRLHDGDGVIEQGPADEQDQGALEHGAIVCLVQIRELALRDDAQHVPTLKTNLTAGRRISNNVLWCMHARFSLYTI